MHNSRRMTAEERQAIEVIAENIFDELVKTNKDLFSSPSPQKKAFVEGFCAGREYTLDQMEDFIEDLEIGES